MSLEGWLVQASKQDLPKIFDILIIIRL